MKHIALGIKQERWVFKNNLPFRMKMLMFNFNYFDQRIQFIWSLFVLEGGGAQLKIKYPLTVFWIRQETIFFSNFSFVAGGNIKWIKIN